VKAPDWYSPESDDYEPLWSAEPLALTVYPPEEGDELGPELLGPDGEVILRRRRAPIGFSREVWE